MSLGMSLSRPHRLLCVWTPVHLGSYPVTPASSRLYSCQSDSESPIFKPLPMPCLGLCLSALCCPMVVLEPAHTWPSLWLAIMLVIVENLFLSFSFLFFNTDLPCWHHPHDFDTLSRLLSFQELVSLVPPISRVPCRTPNSHLATLLCLVGSLCSQGGGKTLKLPAIVRISSTDITSEWN